MAEVCPGGREKKTTTQAEREESQGAKAQLSVQGEPGWPGQHSWDTVGAGIFSGTSEARKNLAGKTALTPLLAVLEAKELLRTTDLW